MPRRVISDFSKACTACKKELPADRFHRQSRVKSGLQSRCKDCRGILARENIETDRASRARWVRDNPEKHLERRRTIQERRKDDPRSVKSDQLYQKYRIRIEDYETMLSSQGGVCAICSQPETAVIRGKVISLAVDHCHETGQIRGLLCGRCNTTIGRAGDSVDLLRLMIDYLETTSCLGE